MRICLGNAGVVIDDGDGGSGESGCDGGDDVDGFDGGAVGVLDDGDGESGSDGGDDVDGFDGISGGVGDYGDEAMNRLSDRLLLALHYCRCQQRRQVTKRTKGAFFLFYEL